MNKNFSAIVFDMDGLLVNSEPTWILADQALIARRGDRFDRSVWQQTVGLNTEESARIYRAHYGWDDTIEDLTNEVHSLMIDLIPQHVTPLPGAQEILDHVVGLSLPTAIASSSVHILIDAVMHRTGWGDYFQVRASSEDVANGKPEPDVYLFAARELSVEPELLLQQE